MRHEGPWEAGEGGSRLIYDRVVSTLALKASRYPGPSYFYTLGEEA